jgi:predicted DNA-binding ribbon-helix-helix protein
MMQKRSLTIRQHRTSVALEPEFWLAIDDMAKCRNVSVSELIAAIDERRKTNNLASACRLEILQELQR